MAGNSKRRGAIRTAGKKEAGVGSGGQRRRGLTGKGPTPPAERRPGHPAARRARRQGDRSEARPAREVILGRNAVSEALAAEIPATELAIGDFVADDARITAARAAATAAGLPVVLRNRGELDRLADGLPHQGVVLVVAPFVYAELHDVIGNRPAGDLSPLVVVLDHLEDSRNLGAISRSAAAFTAAGLVIPQRRAAGVTAAAWRASAGALARVPVARVVNVARSLVSLRRAGFVVVGLATGGGRPLASIAAEVADQPVAVVVGSEGGGLSRLVAEHCDVLATIPITAASESLNASVAAAIAMDRLRNSP